MLNFLIYKTGKIMIVSVVSQNLLQELLELTKSFLETDRGWVETGTPESKPPDPALCDPWRSGGGGLPHLL